MLIVLDKSLFYEFEINFRISLHNLRHSWGWFVSKYKKDRYSAAERLFGEYSSDFYRRGIALSAGRLNASKSSFIEFCYYFFILVGLCISDSLLSSSDYF